ncbi:Mut7-C RNAse domain-containing protein [Saccharopolyspora sp. NPDC050389]|uniref:Mut7-C RNAse domain-containing protein n=1 Tax=Saccharopolyspora sp. NPDC050389 TaxID=3155516 RepID=UPI0033EDB926
MTPEATVLVRIDPDLWFFAAPRRRVEQFELRYDGTATLGHLAESVGVPLTEVGPLLVDGVRATPGHQPRPGATIEIGPVERPQPVAARFVLDVHLGKLARRLRLLGVDTAYRNDSTDDELIAQAERERRVLLTQDRGILRRRALWAGGYVRGADPARQLADVIDRFAPPLAPWTRCTSCNGPLIAVSKQDVLAEIKSGTRRHYDEYARCGDCGQVYWRGAHARRINAIIRAARLSHPGIGPGA